MEKLQYAKIVNDQSGHIPSRQPCHCMIVYVSTVNTVSSSQVTIAPSWHCDVICTLVHDVANCEISKWHCTICKFANMESWLGFELGQYKPYIGHTSCTIRTSAHPLYSISMHWPVATYSQNWFTDMMSDKKSFVRHVVNTNPTYQVESTECKSSHTDIESQH